MMNNTRNDTCSSIPLDNIFLGLSILTLLASSLAFFSNTFVFRLLLQSRSFHSNVLLLLNNFIFSASLLSLVLFSRTIYNFYIWKNGFYEISSLACAWSEIGCDICSTSITFSISFIGLERVITTIWKKIFDDFDHPSRMAYIMVDLCWANGIGTFFILLLTTFFDNASICYCSIVLAMPRSSVFVMSPLYLVVELLAILSYVFLRRQSRSLYSNFTIDTKQHSLAQRYQLVNNIETTGCLGPIMFMHGVTYAFIICIFFYIAASDHDSIISINLAVFILVVLSIETCLHPILLLAKHKKLRKAAIDQFPVLKRFYEEKHNNVVPIKLTTERSISDQGQKSGTFETALVDFRVQPDMAGNILDTMWESKSFDRK